MGRNDKHLPRSGMPGGQTAGQTVDSVEIELDTQQLRALKEADAKPDIDDTAANLELSQSIDDLRNLSWPLWKPRE